MEARPERRKNSNKGRHSEGTVRSNAGLDPDDVREDGAGWRRISATDLLPMLLQPQRPDKEDELFRIK